MIIKIKLVLVAHSSGTIVSMNQYQTAPSRGSREVSVERAFIKAVCRESVERELIEIGV